jgi:hypothetical protein
MRYFVDTEFVFDAEGRTITPLSIALVREDGAYFYTVCVEAFTLPKVATFVRYQVLPALFAVDQDEGIWGTPPGPWCVEEIRIRLRSWIGGDTPEFWGDYAAFDYAVLSIIMGGFENWPEGWPMHINDLQQINAPNVPSAHPHNALADARAVRNAYRKAVQP